MYKPIQWVNPQVLWELLVNYPDKEKAQYVIDGFTRGFPLGIDPEKRPQPWGPCENSDEAKDKPEIVRELVEKELKLGNMLGPFDEPPLPDMVFSPLHLVPKTGSENKYRLIHNLAFPYNEESVNRSILPEESSVQYHYIGELIEMAINWGKTSGAAEWIFPMPSEIWQWSWLTSPFWASHQMGSTFSTPLCPLEQPPVVWFLKG